PVRYRVGNIDPRFDANAEEVKRVAAAAEAIWEGKLGRELFVYDERRGIPINLVFDERQENAEIEENLRDDLEAKAGMNDAVAKQYDALIGEFRSLKKAYESRVRSYETKLAAYNDTVNDWNAKGGAPESEIERLEADAASLKAEQEGLEADAEKLNALVDQLNAIGAKGNTLITDYNSVVAEYNDKVAEAGEFTQGDYTGDAINVYQFNSEDELELVLAHELGHALSLDHVDGKRSIMYRLMEDQAVDDGLTPEDIAEFDAVCAQKSAPAEFLAALREKMTF
ncbi:MAG TPA: matrixin family metalloprotease, partial [Candidatus Paceibacterota bacterium]|nr:matrixin family metalloprotease [Candidatus Paceibacterota bacterium]